MTTSNQPPAQPNDFPQQPDNCAALLEQQEIHFFTYPNPYEED